MEKIVRVQDMNSLKKSVQIYIEGDGDISLNKMNARTERMLTSEDRKKIREVPNIWEDVITSLHWRDGIPTENTYTDCDGEMFRDMLKHNAPCITAFGLKKSFGDAVVRNEIDKYRTKFDNAVNIIANNGLVPIEFAEYKPVDMLMSPVKGAPVNTRLNHFSGWKANFRIDFTEHVYSLEQIVNIINLAGFGLGIGSGRSSGFGRYHVVDVK